MLIVVLMTVRLDTHVTQLIEELSESPPNYIFMSMEVRGIIIYI